MSNTFKLNRHCPKCGKLISDQNKTGFCNLHRNRTGANNSFYGKKHSEETLNRIKEKTKKASTELWKNEEYRNNVLAAVTGLKRSEQFKKEQSERVKHQFDDPQQRKIRSERMKKSWQTGEIVKTDKIFSSTSKQETSFFDILSNYIEVKRKQRISYIEDNKKRWILPDGIVNENIIIEYNGSLWHADPNRYKEDEIVHHNYTAKQIWEADKKKKEIYKSKGYSVIYAWSDNFLKHKEEYVKEIYNKILTIINK